MPLSSVRNHGVFTDRVIGVPEGTATVQPVVHVVRNTNRQNFAITLGRGTLGAPPVNFMIVSSWESVSRPTPPSVIVFRSLVASVLDEAVAPFRALLKTIESDTS